LTPKNGLKTLIYDQITFVKLVRKILVENYWPVMDICRKIYIPYILAY